MPARRRSTRIASSPETSVFDVTGTSTPALVDSATPGKSSPGTTPSLDNVRPKRQPRGRVAALRGKKRAVMSDEEMELGQEDKASARPRKRRATENNAFVELSSASPSEGGSRPKRRAAAALQPSNLRQIRTERKDNDEFDEFLSSEFDPECLESDVGSSGSDFVDEDDQEIAFEIPAVPQGREIGGAPSDSDHLDEDSTLDTPLILGAAANDEEEAEDLEKAIRASLKESIGPSAGPSSSRLTAAALRLLAAERRMHNSNVVDDSDAWELGTKPDVSDTDDDGKGKAPKKRKGKGKGAVGGKPRPMTAKEARRLRAERRLEKHAPHKREELRERKRLGRKLTREERSTIALFEYHPELRTAWGDLEADVPVIAPQQAPQPKDFRATLLPFQQESLYWMREQERSTWKGGILADEMGMGKTIQMLSVLSSDRRKPNLIVAPTVAIMQWKNEIEAHTTGFEVSVWHGQSRQRSASDLAKFDIVLTTYSVLESSFRKQEAGFKRRGNILKEKSLLHAIKWQRIILDEAHNIKERSTNTAKGTFELTGNFKWCLSGTPLQNRVGELYSLIRFLGGDPFAYYYCRRCSCKSLHWKFSDKRGCDDCGHTPMHHTCFWNTEILTPIQKYGMRDLGKTAFKKLRILLDRMMLRRTKVERADDLGLPPRTVIVRRDFFSEEERELYFSLFSDAKRQFSTYVDDGTVLNNYSNIFSLLTRMRQMACHPDLVLKSRRNIDISGEIEEAAVCRLCHDIAEDAIQSKCRHVFDRACVTQYIEASVDDRPECPVCHSPLSIDLEAPAIEQDEEIALKARQGILGRIDHSVWRSSTKIEALTEELDKLRQQDCTTKSIVFSQFVNFLDLIAWRLQKAGFNICRLEGTMSPQARDATIKHFMNNVEVTIFLVSLKAGGVALNLTEASRVYLMDSWWNPAVEYQAMDRIHRLGQHRPVHAIKLVVEDSIEERIIQLQDKKSAMVEATLSPDDSAMGRLTQDDLGFLFRL